MSKGKSPIESLIEPFDAAFLRERYLYVPETGKFYSRRNKMKEVGYYTELGYVRIDIAGNRLRAHRLAWLYCYGEWPKLTIDHINRIRDDNRICNLRLADMELQAANSDDPRRKNKWGVRGLTKYGDSFRVCGRKGRHIGMFRDIESAKAAALAHWGPQ